MEKLELILIIVGTIASAALLAYSLFKVFKVFDRETKTGVVHGSSIIFLYSFSTFIFCATLSIFGARLIVIVF